MGTNSYYNYNDTAVRAAGVNRVENGRILRYGDRIIVRVETPDGKTFSFTTDKMATMTDILGEVRRIARGSVGLSRMSVRNTSRGWRFERPLRLYPERFAPRGFGNVRVHEPSACPDDPFPAPAHIPFHWETH